MSSRPTKLLAFITILISGCSLFENENQASDVSAVIEDGKLVIRNGLHFDVYYFAVAQSSLPYITWAPIVDEVNRVPNNQFIAVDAESLFSYEEGETVAFFYWDEDVSEIFSILIE